MNRVKCSRRIPHPSGIRGFLVSTLRGLAACAMCAVAVGAEGGGSLRVLDSGRHHLGIAGSPEWKQFEGKTPEDRSLQITFSAKPNAESATLLIRQRDVKQKWPILLNGRRLSWLELNETPMLVAYPIPAGGLRDGENTLSVLSPEITDDIVIEGVSLDSRPREIALNEGAVRVHVTDPSANGMALPCRLTVVDEHGYLVPLHPKPGQSLAVRTGVIYTGNGMAEFGLPAGKYTIYANRGFEYGVDQRVVTLRAGQTEQIDLQIRREVPTAGLVACDTHIHTLTMSGHGDATTDERMWTLAGEGVELAIATEHNCFGDTSEAVRRTRMNEHFTNALGIEVTTKAGHFIAFPASTPEAAVPDFKLTDWPGLMKSIRSVPGIEVVILNHPRDVHNGFIPFGEGNFNPVTGENLRGSEFNFDAMELVNSGALQSDFMRGYRDWFALLNYGYRVTAIGSSDSHDVSRFIVGQGRTYIACEDGEPGKIDIEAACRSFKSGRVAVSLGLLTEVTVDEKFKPGDLVSTKGDDITVSVTVLGPSWVEADKVELYANGVRIREQALGRANGKATKASVKWKIPKPPQDVYLVAIASGPGVTAPYWPIASPYQPVERVRNPRVIGSTNPVWVDNDGDGRFSAARHYARQLMQRSGNKPGDILAAAARYDEAVAAHVADLCLDAGLDVRDAAFAEALRAAPEPVRNGFAAYVATLPSK